MSYQSLLSQDEVDALLAGVTGEEDKPKQSQEDTGGVRAYDLSSPDRVVRHRMQTLELINERFARRLRGALLSFMRRNADITVGNLRIQKYSDFERNLPVPSNLNMVALKPLRGTSLFTFDPNLVFLVIDSMFGGHGRYNTRVEGRDFTTTEQRIIGRLLEITLESYRSAWENVFAIETEYIRSEMHTKFASISSGNEIVVVSSFHIELGSTGGKLNICLPYSMIEPVRDLLEIGPDEIAEQFDIVASFLRQRVKGRIGHHDRRGDVGGKRPAGEALRFFRNQRQRRHCFRESVTGGVCSIKAQHAEDAGGGRG